MPKRERALRVYQRLVSEQAETMARQLREASNLVRTPAQAILDLRRYKQVGHSR